MPWLPSLWLREIVNEGGLLRERAFARIPVQKLAAFGQNIARGCASGQLNAQLEPLLLFNSVLALVMLPQATARIWQRLNPRTSFDRATLERHVGRLRRLEEDHERARVRNQHGQKAGHDGGHGPVGRNGARGRRLARGGIHRRCGSRRPAVGDTRLAAQVAAGRRKSPSESGVIPGR